MINISLCFDKNYMPMGLAVMRSIIDVHSNMEIKFFLIVDMDQGSIEALKLEIQELSVEFEVATVDPALFSNLTTKGHITRAAFMRLELGRTFPNLDKLLYLDSDLIVTDSLWGIWNTDLSVNPLAAVKNAGKDGTKRLGLSASHQYFNSGVMLLDMKYFRENNVRESAYLWLEENNSSRAFHDQDALNVIYESKVTILPMRYNLQAFWYRFFLSAEANLQNEIIAEHKIRHILHFSSGRKPWQKGDMHPFKKQFLNFYRAEKTVASNSLTDYVKLAYLWCYYVFVKMKLS
jgi:lipopolysaccharide biosynthesis glycosyltransferase